MTTPVPELTAPVQPELGAELAWVPDGAEPAMCAPELAGDPGCASDQVFRIAFRHAIRPGARITLWLYAAVQPDGYYAVSLWWRRHLDGATRQGWGHWPHPFQSAEDATDMALRAAADPACSCWAGAKPACLEWDGRPW